jgi:5-methylcytosine-specific restriction endonuclease McrBC regulatory subunit McrC
LFNLFVSETYSALKKGLYKTYVKEDNVSPNLKGKLDFRRQIKLEISSKPYFATQRQVFTERNSLNELLYWACKIIESHSNNSKTQALVEQLLKMLPVFNKPNLGKLLSVQPERRGFHLRWAVQLAKLVVNKESLSFQGHQEQLFSMVINLFDLFESYVASELMLRDTKFKHQFELPLVDNTVVANNGWDKRRVFPDLVYNGGLKFVLDVKMKQIRSSGPDISDIYQLHFYATLLGVNKAVLVHPTNQSVEEIKKFPVSYNPENLVEIICYSLPVVGTEEELTRSIEILYQFLMTSV